MLVYIANKIPRYYNADFIRVKIYRIAGLDIGKEARIAGPLVIDISLRRNTLSAISIGRKTYINYNCRISASGSHVNIGDNCMIGPNVSIETASHAVDPYRDRSNGDILQMPVQIGNNVWIGANALILPGVSIGNNCIIAAGAVVTRDVEQGSVVGGVPARLLRNATVQESSDFRLN